MVEILTKNGASILGVLLFIVFSILTLISALELYKTSKSMKNTQAICEKRLMKKQLKVANATSNMLLYLSAIIALLIHNLMPIGIAVTIGIIVNCTVYTNYMKQLRTAPIKY